jgi:hypothetical protein
MNVPLRPAVVVRVPRQVVWRGLRISCAGAVEAMDSAASKAMASKRTDDMVARPNMLLLAASMTNLLPGFPARGGSRRDTGVKVGSNGTRSLVPW